MTALESLGVVFRQTDYAGDDLSVCFHELTRLTHLEIVSNGNYDDDVTHLLLPHGITSLRMCDTLLYPPSVISHPPHRLTELSIEIEFNKLLTDRHISPYLEFFLFPGNALRSFSICIDLIDAKYHEYMLQNLTGLEVLFPPSCKCECLYTQRLSVCIWLARLQVLFFCILQMWFFSPR